MHEDIRKKLEQKMDRRSFLRGSSLVAAAVVGAAAVSPVAAFAQEQQQQQPQDKNDKKNDDQKKQDPYADPYDTGGSSGQGGDSETKRDAQGREFRTCPQCGFNMYRQGRTWTCENCGYSYIE